MTMVVFSALWFKGLMEILQHNRLCPNVVLMLVHRLTYTNKSYYFVAEMYVAYLNVYKR